ncbi:MAG: DUF3330 domain-containing protein [Pseudomonadota bacterium]
MSEQNAAGHDTITCATCHAEVPTSAAHTFEGEDYVQYFCGLQCMTSWKEEQGIPDSDEDGKA